TSPEPGFTSFAIVPYFFWDTSNSHGHDDVAVLAYDAIARRTELAGAFLILQLESDLILLDHFEEIEQVLGVEADFEIGTGVLAGYALFALAGFDAGGEDAHFAVGELHADGARTLVRE